MRVLMAEDDAVLRCLLEELLTGWGHEILVAEDGDEAVELVQKEAFDVAILDWMMPGTTGPDVCKTIRALKRDRHPYIILLTARTQLDDLVIGLDAGADEYLTKPYRPAELAARLRTAARFLGIQDALLQAQKTIAYQAEHDPLVGALNRATFLDRLHNICVERRKAIAPISIVRVDVQGFKALNEKRGEYACDQVLKALTERIAGSLPEGTTIGRTGADELMVLLPHATEDDAERMATELELLVSSASFATTAGALSVTANTQFVTAHTPAELDEGWLLCTLDVIAAVPPSVKETRASKVYELELVEEALDHAV